jgi:hypothetical protein
MFCQIGLCLDYCNRSGRVLLVDTVSAGFGESLEYYFDAPPNAIVSQEDIQSLLRAESVSIFPAHLCKSGLNYNKRWNDDLLAFSTDEDRSSLNLDFSKSYAERIIVHHACGGGMHGKSVMHQFPISRSLRTIIAQRRLALPEEYIGVHIRHTDYRTDYHSLIDQLLKYEAIREQRAPIYLATDNPEVVEYAVHKLPSPIFNFARLIHVDRNLHTTEKLPKVIVNLDAFCDLFLLASATHFVAAKMIQGSYSGFTVLANHWFGDKLGLAEYLKIPRR